MDATTAPTLDPYAKAIEYARSLGAEHGRNAAEWYRADVYSSSGLVPRYDAHGRLLSADAENARRILQGIEDGDPAVLDTFPTPDLSGQWAGRLTGPQLVEDALTAAGITPANTSLAYMIAHDPADICDAYEAAFTEAAEDAIASAARAILA